MHVPGAVLAFAPMIAESSPASAPLGRPRKQRDKRTLAALLRERGVLSTAHGVEIVLDICDALSVAHENGVVHGQLGLGCVRLAFSPEAGPRDVEIFTLGPDPRDPDESAATAIPVAPPFLEPPRPDTCLGNAQKTVDARSDVFALGALLHTMLVGKAPRASNVDIPPESMPLSLASVVEGCLAIDPEARPQTVEAVAESIATFAT